LHGTITKPVNDNAINTFFIIVGFNVNSLIVYDPPEDQPFIKCFNIEWSCFTSFELLIKKTVPEQGYIKNEMQLWKKNHKMAG